MPQGIWRGNRRKTPEIAAFPTVRRTCGAQLTGCGVPPTVPRMSADPPADGPKAPPKKMPPARGGRRPPRQEELAAALRENLRRRKAQAVARNLKPGGEKD